jgi:hypothetical protein
VCRGLPDNKQREGATYQLSLARHGCSSAWVVSAARIEVAPSMLVVRVVPRGPVFGNKLRLVGPLVLVSGSEAHLAIQAVMGGAKAG